MTATRFLPEWEGGEWCGLHHFSATEFGVGDDFNYFRDRQFKTAAQQQKCEAPAIISIT